MKKLVIWLGGALVVGIAAAVWWNWFRAPYALADTPTVDVTVRAQKSPYPDVRKTAQDVDTLVRAYVQRLKDGDAKGVAELSGPDYDKPGPAAAAYVREYGEAARGQACSDCREGLEVGRAPGRGGSGCCQTGSMPKKRTTDKNFAEVVASLEAAEGSDPADGRLSPASAGELVDAEGRLWTKKRGPLDARPARRLVRDADEVIIGESAGELLRPVPADGREEAWALIKDALEDPESGTYRAYDFRSEDGRTLLYVEEFC